jgi:hypothetical protein
LELGGDLIEGVDVVVVNIESQGQIFAVVGNLNTDPRTIAKRKGYISGVVGEPFQA